MNDERGLMLAISDITHAVDLFGINVIVAALSKQNQEDLLDILLETMDNSED